MGRPTRWSVGRFRFMGSPMENISMQRFKITTCELCQGSCTLPTYIYEDSLQCEVVRYDPCPECQGGGLQYQFDPSGNVSNNEASQQ
jgi:hypothetical protein